MGEDATHFGHRARGLPVRVRSRHHGDSRGAVRYARAGAQQTVHEIIERSAVRADGAASGSGSTASGGIGHAAGDRCTGLKAATQDRSQGRGQQARGDQRSDGPGEETMGGIAEVHFVRVHLNPSRAQAPGDVAAHRRGKQLGEREPHDGRDSEARRADAIGRPWRNRRQTEPHAQHHQDQRQDGGGCRSSENRTPRHGAG